MKNENVIRTEVKSHVIHVNINCEIDINKCLFTKNGNIKLGKMWVFSKLYSDEVFYIRDYDITVQGTCCGCCEGCKSACYVKKSYRYGSVIKSHAVRTLAMRYGRDTLFDALNRQLKRARKKPSCVRIDQSGEIETSDELKKMD